MEVLNRRLADARQQSGPAAVGAAAAAAETAAEAADTSDADQQPSFLRSTDEEVSAALAQRIAEVASTKAPGGGSAAGSLDEADEEAEDDSVEGAGLTGPLLRELIFNKWGKTYDLSFVRRVRLLGGRSLPWCLFHACKCSLAVPAKSPFAAALAWVCSDHVLHDCSVR